MVGLEAMIAGLEAPLQYFDSGPGSAVGAAGAILLIALYLAARGATKIGPPAAVKSGDPIPAGAVAGEDDGAELEVEGTARRLDETTISDYEKRECLGYVTETRRRFRNDWRPYRTVDAGSDGVPFLVEDDSGRVAVDPENADWHLDTASTTWFLGRLLSWRNRYEGTLEDGEDVFVAGTKRVATDEDPIETGEPYVGDGDWTGITIADATRRGVLNRHLKTGGAYLLVGGAIALVGAWLVVVLPT